MEASSGGNHVKKIMTFRPTWEEFKDFNKYIEYVESQGAHKAGVCKIIPPKEWVPRKRGYKDVNLIIPAPIQQVVHGKQGLYTQLNVQKKPIALDEFQRLTERPAYKTPPHTDDDDLERRYWKNITFVNPIYGADVSGSLTDRDQDYWNIQRLGSILDCLTEDYGISIEGVNTAYLYFGMWKTTFAWHTEDMDLYSINYVHYGAPKRWYAVPPEHGRRFERLAAGFFSENSETCPAFLRHKMSLISPTILKRYSIPCDTIVQRAGEIMITFPYGYHSGFNHGFNCAESTNFASRRWIEYGKRCAQCFCRKDGVRIDMGPFVRKFQPALHDLWKAGKDYAPHPEDDRSKLYNHHHNEIVSSTSPSKRVVVAGKKHALGGAAHAKLSQKKHRKSSASTDEQDTTDKEPQSLADAKVSGSDMDEPTDVSDAPTDLSDALTDVEVETCSQKLSNETASACSDSPTRTKTCKSKKHKSDDSSIIKINQPWAKSLNRLWKFNKIDFDAEKRYNYKMSRRAPFCAVCSVLSHEESAGKPVKSRTPPTTIPLLPQSCFMSIEMGQLPKLSTKPRVLLICKDCNVCVHDTCYGVKFLPNGPMNWQCSRCVLGCVSAECVLCCLRGGALKHTSDDKWAHIVCAIANSEVSFRWDNAREPIILTNISKSRGTLKCCYCGSVTHVNGKDRYGKCVQCSTGQCSKAFHLTCAQAAGLKIDIGTGPLRLHITCYKHSDSSRRHEEQATRPALELKDEVYAKYKNGRYYKGELLDICTQIYYCVLFEDNSSSKDLYPQDILNYPPGDVPPLGARVSVKWTDGLIYQGFSQGTRTVQLYTVLLENGSEVQLEKEHVYSIHEQLPTHVQKKLSCATEMKNDVFYRKDKDLITKTRTRGVQVNYNYKWDTM
ncbi:lysine-specific demethylase 4A-like isoform X2 [Watersipora subatra]|uniref:lysine-specific demethylase 4A-like isoform X2 n=1 Tax=Watersipora subatra TaxID=2589382 RepID=UPI00355C5746